MPFGTGGEFSGGGGGGGGGGGTVSSVSVVTANGLSGTVSNPTTTPAITLQAATAATGDNSTNVATTAFVQATSFNLQVGNILFLSTQAS